MQVIVKSLETVLGEGHPQLKGLETTMSAMSSEKMASVAETIAERMAQVAAGPAIGCSCSCNQDPRCTCQVRPWGGAGGLKQEMNLRNGIHS
jgi:hypothetical protein